MALSKIQPASMDLTDNYAFTGTNSISGAGDIEETKLATLTASSSATLNFTSGIDNTYNIYKFRFVNMHPSGDGRNFEFNTSVDGGSNYNVTKTSTSFVAYHNEGDSVAPLAYEADGDEAQGTGYVHLAYNTGADNDQTCSGQLYLFNPSSTTFVKHWINVSNSYQFNDYSTNTLTGGYFNTTSAINAVSFKFHADNIDSGTIEMYGIN